jgi:malate dehydrogenase
MAIPSTGAYGISEGIIYSFPVKIQNGAVSVIESLENDVFITEKMQASEAELLEERAAVEHLL